MSTELKEQQISADESGKPILGYIIKKSELPEFQAALKKAANGRSFMMGTKEEGDMLKIKVIGVSFELAQELKDAMEEVSFKAYAKAPIDVGTVSFDDFDDSDE